MSGAQTSLAATISLVGPHIGRREPTVGVITRTPRFWKWETEDQVDCAVLNLFPLEHSLDGVRNVGREDAAHKGICQDGNHESNRSATPSFKGHYEAWGDQHMVI